MSRSICLTQFAIHHDGSGCQYCRNVRLALFAVLSFIQPPHTEVPMFAKTDSSLSESDPHKPTHADSFVDLSHSPRRTYMVPRNMRFTAGTTCEWLVRMVARLSFAMRAFLLQPLAVRTSRSPES